MSIIVALPLVLMLPAAPAAEPHHSYDRLVSANGYGVLVMSGDPGAGVVLDRFSDHLYQQENADADPVRDLLYDAYFGLRVDGSAAWLQTANSVAYAPASNMLIAERQLGDVVLTERAWAPMGLEAPAWVHIAEVENRGARAASVSVFALQNFHLGDSADDGVTYTVGERISESGGVLTEQGDGTGLVMQSMPLVAPDLVGCDAVYDTVLGGGDLAAGCGRSGDDLSGAFQWNIGELGPGERRWVGVAHGFSSGFDTSTMPDLVRAWAADQSPDELVAAELMWWEDWLALGTAPASMTADEADVYAQALVSLKMAQVREPGGAYGQIPASLPASAAVGGFQHEWNITWVRDGAYAIQALVAAGYSDEAAAALAFMIQPGASGEYADYLGVDAYAVSVCRYYGDGTEWSDWDDNGPNIELDDFGLFLWAFTSAVRAGDAQLLQDHGPTVLDGVADVLVATVDPAFDLLDADSSIWERHWNGQQKHFTFSSAWGARGLADAAWLAEQLGDGRAQTYEAASMLLAGGVAEHLVHDEGWLAGNLEELQRGEGAVDVAAIEAFNAGVLDPRGAVANATLDHLLTALAVPGSPGLKRNDDGDLYDEQEWIWADLRAAEALRRACRVGAAETLEDWVLAHALENHHTIPELLAPETADYAGPAPMMGFGSGLWVLNLHGRDAAAAACEGVDTGDPIADDTGVPGDGGGDDGGASASDTGTDGTDGATPQVGGCGCASTGRAAGAMWAVVLLGAVRRRRGNAASR